MDLGIGVPKSRTATNCCNNGQVRNSKNSHRIKLQTQHSFSLYTTASSDLKWPPFHLAAAANYSEGLVWFPNLTEVDVLTVFQILFGGLFTNQNVVHCILHIVHCKFQIKHNTRHIPQSRFTKHLAHVPIVTNGLQEQKYILPFISTQSTKQLSLVPELFLFLANPPTFTWPFLINSCFHMS